MLTEALCLRFGVRLSDGLACGVCIGSSGCRYRSSVGLDSLDGRCNGSRSDSSAGSDGDNLGAVCGQSGQYIEDINITHAVLVVFVS